MTSTPDEERTEGRTLARELFGSPADTTEPDEDREPIEDAGDTGDPKGASATEYARQLFSHHTN